MDRIAREKKRKDLLRVGMDITPEKYYADAIVISLWILCLGALFILIGFPLFFAISVILSCCNCAFNNIEVVNKKINFIKSSNNKRFT